MALRDYPYLPLYVQDFMTDEKLMRCSAEATGVYIRLMCVMHKSEQYGVFAIREKDRISDNISDDFARVFSSFSPFSQEVVRRALEELLEEEVIYIYRNWLCQKRMIRDAKLSEARAKAGKKGAQKRHNKNNDICHGKIGGKAPGKSVANTESESEYESEYEYDDVKEQEELSTRASTQQIRFDSFWLAYPKKVGKEAARKSWLKVKPSTELYEKIMFAVDVARQSDQWQCEKGRFIPNPATWLNQGRWDDELPVDFGRQRTPMDDLRELHDTYTREEDEET